MTVRLAVALSLAVFAGSLIGPAPSAHADNEFFSPANIELRAKAAEAAAAANQFDAEMTARLLAAAKEFEVNDQDAAKAVNTTAAALLPWTNASQILFPQVLGDECISTVLDYPRRAQHDHHRGTQPDHHRSPAHAAHPPPSDRIRTTCCAQLEALRANANSSRGVAADGPAVAGRASLNSNATAGFRSNLPVVVVDTSGRVVRLRNQVAASVCTCGAPGGLDYEGAAAIQVRGSSSAVQMVKKSLGLTFRSVSIPAQNMSNSVYQLGSPASWTLGSKVDVPFLGMAPASAWVLFGDDNDMTLGMRNALAYDLTRAMGRWAPNTAFFELFLVQDGQPLSPSHYWGAYLALERIEVHPNRLNLAALNARRRDLTGGYLLGFERSMWPTDVRVVPSEWASTGNGNSSGGVCPSGDGRSLTYVMHAPDAKGAQKQQQGLGPASNDTRLVAWAASYLGSVEAALVRDALPAGSQVEPGGGGWRALVHQGAFIDYMISQELPKNPDAHRGSVYMYKGVSNGTSGGSAISPEGWRFNICDEPERCQADPVDGISTWWRATWRREPAFRLTVARRWAYLRSGALSDLFFTSRFQAYQAQLAFAAPRNYIRWRAVLSPSSTTSSNDIAKGLYESAVQQMQNWTFSRLAWMDSEFKRVEAQLSPSLDEGSQGAPPLTVIRPPLQDSDVRTLTETVVTCADQAAARASANVTQQAAFGGPRPKAKAKRALAAAAINTP